MDPEHRGNWSPATLDSPRPGSIYHATSTMDDLTMALTNYTHASEPPPPLTCCCGREECEHTKSWQAYKAKLEGRLILSAEVGQALLQKYEASVRRTESGRHRRSPSQDTEVDVPEDSPNPREFEIRELEQANASLEKRLSQALLANEVSDSTHKSALRDLEEAQASVTRLSAYHARTVGLDTRLMVVMREKDDIQQERDSETQRARVAESRISALKERTTKLQIEVHRLQQDLEQRRQHRLELSEEILQDARSRLQTLQEYQLGRDTLAEENEVTKVLESLVADNENLKHDNAELQNLLSDTREDLRALQEEVGEHRAGFSGGSRAVTPQLFSPASIKDESVPHSRRRRPASLEPRSRQGLEPLTHIHIQEPLTPEPDRRPLSPPDSLIPPAKLTSFNRHRSRYSSSHTSHASIELEVEDGHDEGPASPSPRVGTPHRSLLLLSQSRGVQTDSYPGLLAPSPMPHAFGDYLSSSSPVDGHSEASSVAETNSTHIGILLDRIATLLTRLTQADPLTLTNRLKRQNLKGADVGHLSRATVASIVSDASQLRAQFRAILEDDKVPVTCTRKDLRTLFKVFREFFTETGQLRTTLNDIIIDPSIAAKVSEMALDPAKAAEKERQAAKGPSWMAPLTKLFGAPSPTETPPPTREGPSSTLRPPTRGVERQPSRRVPKLGAALAASTTTTVNVEFSGGGGGRAMARTASESPSTRSVPSNASSPPPTQVHGSLMNIFAGAPQPADPWVVIPATSRRGASDGENGAVSGTATIGRSGMPNARSTAGMSQNVDAVIDLRGQDDENDIVAPLLQRTLRRRGLSDSSIHSSFMAQSEDDPASPRDTSTFGLWPQRGGMFRSISQTVQQGLRYAAASTTPQVHKATDDAATPPAVDSPASSPPRAIPQRKQSGQTEHASPSAAIGTRPRRSLIPGLASWAIDPDLSSSLFGTTPRDDHMHRARDSHGRDF